MKNFRIKGRSLFVQGFNGMKQPWGRASKRLTAQNQCDWPDWGPEMVALGKTNQRYVRMCSFFFFLARL